MMRKILYIEPVVSEMVDSWQKYLSQFKRPETELEELLWPRASGILFLWAVGCA